MAKSSRASRIKKNNQALKKRVFGPVEQARNERLHAKLLELAQKPKAKEIEMVVEQEDDAKEGNEETAQQVDIEMDATASSTKPQRSKREVKRLQAARAERQERSSRKKPRNQVRFPTPARKKSRQGKR